MPGMPATTRGSDRHRTLSAHPGHILRAPATRVPPDPVDAADVASVSLRPGDGTVTGFSSRPAPSTREGQSPHGLVAVGPGMAGAVLLGVSVGRIGMNPLPVQLAKIVEPPLRHDTLSRPRLNGWLDKAATGRLALVIAEAGFGKTTFLADWARTTRRATAWYRLEPDDRDWLAFVRHLVATGRDLSPSFAPLTYELLLGLGPGGPTRDDLVASIVREMAEFADVLPHGLCLLLDDYHAVDGSPETDPIVQALLNVTGPAFSIVIASRSAPAALSLAGLRSRSGVARLDGDDLSFTVDETERLFRDAYRLPLDADVIADLVERTQGWAALLSLVHASLDGRPISQAREFFASLHGGRGDLYDFLADEVFQTLPQPLESFLTRAAVLPQITPRTASLVDQRPIGEIELLIAEAEAAGLLSRRGRDSAHQYHPLVREFLLDRLVARVGSDAVRELHRVIGLALAPTDWRAAVGHFVEAKEVDLAAQTVDAAVPTILAEGQFDQVVQFLDGSAGRTDRPGALIVRSRLELGRGHIENARDLARRAVEAANGDPLAGTALLNVAALFGVAGFESDSIGYVQRALEHPLSESQLMIAKSTVALWEACQEGNLEVVAEDLRLLAAFHSRAGHGRHAGISRMNLAATLTWLGRTQEAEGLARLASLDLAASGASQVERVAAQATQARALAHSGRFEEAVSAMASAEGPQLPISSDEAALEAAGIFVDCGSTEAALGALARVDPASLAVGYQGLWAITAGGAALRRGDVQTAIAMCRELEVEPCRDVCGKLRAQLLRARVALAIGSSDARAEVAELSRIANAQRSRPGRRWAELLEAVAQPGTVHAEILRADPEDSFTLSSVAEEICRVLNRLSPEARARVANEARRQPDRWRTALRLGLGAQDAASMACASLLAEIGGEDDGRLLRAMSTSRRALRAHAAQLTRRIAPIIYIEDLGAVRVTLGGQAIDRGLRRKALGLLCFVASRRGMAATKDEVLEALWPDLGPDTATNSLHQTIYFLRRVFEPEYKEGLSAGYVQFDGEVVTLDAELVDSASRRCWRLLEAGRLNDDQTSDLLRAYTGRYALDFAYEDWASAYRETLHAGVLGAAEAAISRLSDLSQYDRAISIALTILTIDPTADPIELALLRAYKAGDRRAAAAEQYEHYSSVLRDELGAEPPAFDAI